MDESIYKSLRTSGRRPADAHPTSTRRPADARPMVDGNEYWPIFATMKGRKKPFANRIREFDDL